MQRIMSPRCLGHVGSTRTSISQWHVTAWFCDQVTGGDLRRHIPSPWAPGEMDPGQHQSSAGLSVILGGSLPPGQPGREPQFWEGTLPHPEEPIVGCPGRPRAKRHPNDVSVCLTSHPPLLLGAVQSGLGSNSAGRATLPTWGEGHDQWPPPPWRPHAPSASPTSPGARGS